MNRWKLINFRLFINFDEMLISYATHGMEPVTRNGCTMPAGHSIKKYRNVKLVHIRQYFVEE